MAELYHKVGKKALKQIISNVMDTCNKAKGKIESLETDVLLAKQESYEHSNVNNVNIGVIKAQEIQIKELIESNNILSENISKQEREIKSKIESYHLMEKRYNDKAKEVDLWRSRCNNQNK